jgi:hypothetical protein
VSPPVAAAATLTARVHPDESPRAGQPPARRRPSGATRRELTVISRCSPGRGDAPSSRCITALSPELEPAGQPQWPHQCRCCRRIAWRVRQIPAELMRQAFVAGQITQVPRKGRLGGRQCRAVGGVRARSGYFGRMARPGRSEDTSVPIWLKLSAVDSAKMDQVLARPEFEGWTKGEWCLEIIQTALRYYTRPRPVGEPGRRRAPTRPVTAPASPPAETVSPPTEAVSPPTETVSPPTETVSPPTEAVPPPAEPEPSPAETASPPARPARTTARRPPPVKRTSPSREPEPVVPERPQPRRPSEPEQPQSRRPRLKLPQPPEPAPRQPEPPPQAQPEPTQPDTGRPDTGRLDSAEADRLPELECSHPAEARDYQSGTCVACGAILWD